MKTVANTRITINRNVSAVVNALDITSDGVLLVVSARKTTHRVSAISTLMRIFDREARFTITDDKDRLDMVGTVKQATIIGFEKLLVRIWPSQTTSKDNRID